MSKLFPHLASATVPGPSIAEGGGDGANPLPPGLLQRLLNFATAAEEASEAGTVSGAQLTPSSVCFRSKLLYLGFVPNVTKLSLILTLNLV